MLLEVVLLHAQDGQRAAGFLVARAAIQVHASKEIVSLSEIHYRIAVLNLPGMTNKVPPCGGSCRYSRGYRHRILPQLSIAQSHLHLLLLAANACST